jgi:hypothetical protein
MKVGILGAPRPEPSRLLPIAAAATIVVVAAPVFVVAGWPLRAWALAAVLWLGGQALTLLLARLRGETASLASSGVLAFGMMFRAIVVMVALLAVAASNAKLGLAAALVYALAYTAELALSLLVYFGEPTK